MWETLIGMGSKLISGMMGQNAQENANAANQALQQTQMAYQHEANTHGVRWKVADAIAAGLHPLAALGVNPASGFSASVGRQEPENAMGNALGDMGQDITRAINATRTQSERNAAFAEQLKTLAVDRGELQNKALELQIKRLEQQLNPPAPGAVDVKPAEATTTAPGRPFSQPGEFPAVDYERTQSGWAPMPGKISKERQEDDFIASTWWKLKQYGGPAFNKSYAQPPVHLMDLKPHEEPYWNPIAMEWQKRNRAKSQERYDDRKYYPENNIIRLR